MSAAASRPFPLVPRRRFLGVQFGRRRTARRGDGDEIAGTRPYQPGDLTAHIHWAASARLSEARGTDEFVVREFFAEQAPRVALVTDRRPAMAIHPAPAPWLDKRRAAESAARLIAASALAEQGEVALSDGTTRSATWLRGPGGALATIDRRARGAYDGDAEALRAALDALDAQRNHTACRQLRLRRLGFSAAGSDSGLGSSALAPLGRDAGGRAGSRLGDVVPGGGRSGCAARRSRDGRRGRRLVLPSRSA